MGRSRTVTNSARSGSDDGESRGKKNESIKKHYPWLETFDKKARAFVGSEVELADVLQLLTELERHVSPEVSNLKTRPNRASKFLGQIRKRISLVKIAGLMASSESRPETLLFPTYGLLMMHEVNISLISSKVSKHGAEKVAAELYYNLKLIFEGEYEYILDVALCSTLEEYASSSHKIGYRLFSLIVEDWRLYSYTHATQMKYCAICTLLSQACDDGKRFVDETLPNRMMEKGFLKYLRRVLGDDVGGPFKKVTNFKGLLQYIKPTTIKSIARSRLVVVSQKDISDSGCSDSDSSSSTVNIAGSSGSAGYSERGEMPSSSGYCDEDPMHKILGELGLGDNFYLDTAGGNPGSSSEGTQYYNSNVNDYLGGLDSDPITTVSSSTRRQSSIAGSDVNGGGSEPMDNGGSDVDSSRWIHSPSPPIYSPRSPVVNEPIASGEAGDNDSDDDDEGRLVIDTDTGSSKKTDDDNKSDSDLEVVSVIDKTESMNDAESDSNDDARSRDEEEADPEEDVVPNYDIDSDMENERSPARSDLTLTSKESPMKGVKSEDISQEADSGRLSPCSTEKLHDSPKKTLKLDFKYTESNSENEIDEDNATSGSKTSNLGASTPTKSSPSTEIKNKTPISSSKRQRLSDEQDKEEEHSGKESSSEDEQPLARKTPQSATSGMRKSTEQDKKKYNVESSNDSGSENDQPPTKKLKTPQTSPKGGRRSITEQDKKSENKEEDLEGHSSDDIGSEEVEAPAKKTKTPETTTRGRRSTNEQKKINETKDKESSHDSNSEEDEPTQRKVKSPQTATRGRGRKSSISRGSTNSATPRASAITPASSILNLRRTTRATAGRAQVTKIYGYDDDDDEGSLKEQKQAKTPVRKTRARNLSSEDDEAHAKTPGRQTRARTLSSEDDVANNAAPTPATRPSTRSTRGRGGRGGATPAVATRSSARRK